MGSYEAEVISWNWIRSYGIAKITNVTNVEEQNMINKEVFIFNTFISREQREKWKKDENSGTTIYNDNGLQEDFGRGRAWFDRGETVSFNIQNGVAYNIAKVSESD